MAAAKGKGKGKKAAGDSPAKAKKATKKPAAKKASGKKGFQQQNDKLCFVFVGVKRAGKKAAAKGKKAKK
ncbi:hypothetical protein KUTeg_022472 [Tegillarca granosa]|uniref:Uncharacterized protein n=1 Tax=Tegillarca granosa TaxID=220873 RepID=A0ABQ9E6A9_TEGGR|nr:hypothetical protein KUTeg_022472 [Tegillarca granosa]